MKVQFIRPGILFILLILFVSGTRVAVFAGEAPQDVDSAPQWQPPIGIPTPPFGIKEQAPPPPDSWSVPAAPFVYVDADNPHATDTNNPLGSRSRPRLTIPLSLAEGTVVEIEGDYTTDHSGGRAIRANGTAEQPIFIRGIGPSRARLTRSLSIYGSYAVVENILFDHSKTTASGGDAGMGVPNEDANQPADCSTQKRPACADHIVFRHNELMGSTGPAAFRHCGGLGVGGWVDDLPSGSSQEYIVFWDNNIHDEGQTNPLTDKDQPCTAINVGRYAHHIWILDNTCTNIAQSCVQIVPTTNGSAYRDTHHIYVGRNVADRAGKNAFWCKAASDVIFSQNVAHDTVEKSYNPSAAFGLQYGPQRVWFLYNEAYNVTGGFWLAGDSNGGTDQRYFMIGNLIHDITNGGHYFTRWEPEKPWSAAAIFNDTGAEVHVVGNVIWGLQEANGINKPVGGGIMELTGNIIGNLQKDSALTMLFEDDREFMSARIDQDNFSPVRIRAGDYRYPSVGSLHSAGHCKKCVDSDPLFQDPANGNFRLRPGSPMADITPDTQAYDTFLKLYGIDIRPAAGNFSLVPVHAASRQSN